MERQLAVMKKLASLEITQILRISTTRDDKKGQCTLSFKQNVIR